MNIYETDNRSKRPHIGSLVQPRRADLRRRLFFALVGTLVALLSAILLASKESQATGLLGGQAASTPTTHRAAPVQEPQTAPVARQPTPPTIQQAPEQGQPSPPQQQASEPVSGTLAPALGGTQQTSEPVEQGPTEPVIGTAIDTTAPVREPVREPVNQTFGTVGEGAEPITGPTQQTVKPAVDTAQQTADPALKPVAGIANETTRPVLDPVKEAVEPAIRPVADKVEKTAKPVLDPVSETADPLVRPVVDPIKETVDAGIKPVRETLDPVVQPGADTQPSGQPRPAIAPSPQITDHNVEPATDPRLRVKGSPVVGHQTFEEPILASSRGANISSALAAAGRSLSDSPSVTFATARQHWGDLVAGFSPKSMSSEQPMVGSAAVKSELSDIVLYSTDEHSSILLFASITERGVQGGLAQSLPFHDAMPAVPASGGVSSSSAPSFGGTSPDFSGALALLLIALLGGKFVWYARTLLKPNSVFQLVINQPG